MSTKPVQLLGDSIDELFEKVRKRKASEPESKERKYKFPLYFSRSQQIFLVSSSPFLAGISYGQSKFHVKSYGRFVDSLG